MVLKKKSTKETSLLLLFHFGIFFFIVNICFSQKITLNGKITDSSGVALEYANVFAYPDQNGSIVYAISNENGDYKLTLLKDQLYNITVSYLGFTPQDFKEKSFSEDRIKNITLIESAEGLEEVRLSYEPPVTIKKDTITYLTDAFATGEERKLRDILKKLPGVEVDRAGNVSVQGKRVTKVLVEDKEFFTGDSKLAVNNIPAGAVDKIQVLDNFNDVSFLKNLEDSEDVAMNIKLKANKKKFVFGDVESGVGFKKRYVVHPSMYYYSPNTSMNFIGDLNNTGTRSFTIKDFIEFEGGRDNLINNARGYLSPINDDIAQFIGGRDFKDSRNQFAAISLNEAINEKTELSSYGIFSNEKNETEVRSLNEYTASDNLIENRSETGKQVNLFSIGKLKFRYKPNEYSVLTFGSYVKISDNNLENNISTITDERSNNINTNIGTGNFSLKQNGKWHRQFNTNHTTSAIFNYNYQNANTNNGLLTDRTILPGLIPVIDQDVFNILKKKKTKSHNIDFILKHYWSINRLNHLYFSLGTSQTFDNYKTRDFQILEDLSINDFVTSNFTNNSELNYRDLFFGLQYKFKKGKFTFKPGIFYHNYKWGIKQFDDVTTNSKTILLPELDTEVELSQTKKINFNYNLKARFPNISQTANRFTLLDFNIIYQGNENLKNELYHVTQLRFYSFDLYKDLFYNFTTSYSFKEDNFKNNITIQGIDFVSSPILSDFEDKSLSFSGSIKKGIGKYKFLLKGNLLFSDYENPVNQIIIANTSDKYSFGAGVETSFDNFPNLELNYSKSINLYKGLTNSEFHSDLFSIFLEYDFFNSFIFKGEYRFESYRNNNFNIMNTFDTANASLFYQKGDSAWGLEISATNLFDVDFRQRNSFSSFLISDVRTSVLPRIIILKISYKL